MNKINFKLYNGRYYPFGTPVTEMISEADGEQQTAPAPVQSAPATDLYSFLQGVGLSSEAVGKVIDDIKSWGGGLQGSKIVFKDAAFGSGTAAQQQSSTPVDQPVQPPTEPTADVSGAATETEPVAQTQGNEEGNQEPEQADMHTSPINVTFTEKLSNKISVDDKIMSALIRALERTWKGNVEFDLAEDDTLLVNNKPSKYYVKDGKLQKRGTGEA